MKKVTFIFAIFLLFGLGYAQNVRKQDSPPRSRANTSAIKKQTPKKQATKLQKLPEAPEGMVNVTLEAHDVYGDGSGYQLLLDPVATALETTPIEGSSIPCDAIPAGLYDLYAHKIPADADPDCTTENVMVDDEITIQVPVGTYDYVIFQPYNNLYIAGNGEAKGDNFEFKEGKNYRFLLEPYAGMEKLTLIEESVNPGLVNLTLEAGDFNDAGLGFQLLLDSTHSVWEPDDEINFTLPACGEIPAGKYDVFRYKIPANADPVCGTSNVLLNQSQTIQIPAGVYDMVVTNPQSDNIGVINRYNFFITEDGSSDYSTNMLDNFRFQEGKMYRLEVGLYGYGEMIIEVQPEAESPTAPTELALTAGSEGALTATLEWKNPSLDFAGNSLAELTAVKVYEDDGTEPVHTISNPVPGATETYGVTVEQAGRHTYKIVAENSYGTASATTQQVWIGPDRPAGPTNVVLVKSGDTAKLSWSPVTQGSNGGYIDLDSIFYVVKRNYVPVSEHQADTTFEEVFTQSMGQIFYQIFVKYGVNGTEGEMAMSNTVSFCQSITSFPWTENFDGADLGAACWSPVVGAYGWGSFQPSYSGGRNGTNGVVHNADNSYSPVEDWLISPAVEIPDTEDEYKLTFWTKSDNAYNAAYHGVWISTTDDQPASFVQIRELLPNEDIFGDWTQIEVDLSDYAGQTIYFAFKYSCTTNKDSWFLDDVTVQKVVPMDAAALKVYGSTTPMEQKWFNYKVAVKNQKDDAMSNYTVKLVDGSGSVVTASITDGATIAPGDTAFINFAWMPATTGAVALRAIVEVSDDIDPTNNESPVLNVNVQAAESTLEQAIGTEQTRPIYNIPFNFYFYNSVSQSLYFDHELIGQPAAISEVKYFNNFTSDLTDKPIKIWMANTDLNTMNAWLAADQFTLVYDGTMDFPSGKNTITIPLDIPFEYSGQNLVIMTERPMEERHYEDFDQFYTTRDLDFKGRTIYYESYEEEFDFSQEGTISNNYPNTELTFALERGSISGTISDGSDPVEGALVEVEGTNLKYSTDETGYYRFEIVLPGSYKVKASKFGYQDAVTASFNVVDGDNLNKDLLLTALPIYTVNGKITGSDAASGLEGVEITLQGYDDYSATTDASGNYSIADVLGGFTYQMQARKGSYQPFNASVSINGDTTIDAELLENAYPVLDAAVALSQDETQAVITWKAHEAIQYKLDDGTIEHTLTLNPGFNRWLGNKFEVGESGELTSIDLHGSYNVAVTTEQKVTLEIFNEAQELVGVSNPFVIPADDWVNIPLNNIPYSGTFYAMVHWNNLPRVTHYLSIDCNGENADAGMDMRYDGEEWTSSHEFMGDQPGIHLIRANANSLGQAKSYGAKPTQNMAKSLEKYEVYRLTEGQAEPWTKVGETDELTYTDEDWSTLANGVYQYAVKAVYTDDNVSNPALTNTMPKGMEAEVTVNLTANSGDEVDDAVITLTNRDGDAAHVYTATVTDEETIFPKVWKGTYDISATLAGYESYTSDAAGVEITVDKIISIVLEELIETPFGLEIQETGTDGERLFSWNNTYFEPFFDDMESYDNFIIENIGDYIMQDLDGIETYEVEPYTWNNSGYTGSFMVFNPAETTPSWSHNEAAAAYSGNKYLACFAAKGQNDDWLILPKNKIEEGVQLSFMAKSLESLYGLERFKVAVSTAGTDAPDDFMIISEGNYVEAPAGAWTKYTYDLSSYAGRDVYVAIVCVSNGTRFLMLDDITVDYADAKNKHLAKSFNGYSVYLNGEVKATDLTATEYLFEELPKGDYVAGVKSVYSGSAGESELQTVNFTVTEDITAIANLLPNPEIEVYSVRNEIFVDNPNNIRLNAIQVFDLSGHLIHETKSTSSVSFTLNVPAGHYFVRLIPETGKPSATKVYLTK